MDGIGQSPLTLALQMDHSNTAKLLIECGASVNVIFFEDMVPPIKIAKVKENAALFTQIESEIKQEQTIIGKTCTYFVKNTCFQHDDDDEFQWEKKQTICMQDN